MIYAWCTEFMKRKEIFIALIYMNKYVDGMSPNIYLKFAYKRDYIINSRELITVFKECYVFLIMVRICTYIMIVYALSHYNKRK